MDRREAERLYRCAAEAGHRQAIASLAYLLKERGDTAEAEQWFRKAAQTGHLSAMWELEKLLRERGQVAEAEQWFHKRRSGEQCENNGKHHL